MKTNLEEGRQQNITQAITVLILLVFTMLLFVCGNSSAVVIIDSNTRNGSFETGQLDPWSSPDGVLVNDASFASNGEYYAKLEITTGRVFILQRSFPIDKNMGSVFTFHIDVRNGVNPFGELDVSLYGKTYAGEFVYASRNLFNIPASAQNTWVTFSGTTAFKAADWQVLDPANLHFGIQLSGTYGTSLQGFVDNIALSQIPEPATICLFAIAGLMLRRK